MKYRGSPVACRWPLFSRACLTGTQWKKDASLSLRNHSTSGDSGTWWMSFPHVGDTHCDKTAPTVCLHGLSQAKGQKSKLLESGVRAEKLTQQSARFFAVAKGKCCVWWRQDTSAMIPTQLCPIWQFLRETRRRIGKGGSMSVQQTSIN